MSMIKVDALRLLEQTISNVPPDVWNQIFSYIDPSSRVELMWGLQLLIPAFTWIFSNTPGLWTDWVLNGDRLCRQSRATRYAMDFWSDLYVALLQNKDERGPPLINIHVVKPPFSFLRVLFRLPPESLPFIRSIDLELEHSDLDPLQIRLFLEHFPSLSHFSVDVVDRMLGATGVFGAPSSTAIFVDEAIPDDSRGPERISLSSLALVGAAPSIDTFNNIDLSRLTTLRLADQVIRDNDYPSLYDILQRTPNVREVVYHSHWAQFANKNCFWNIPLNHQFPYYTTSLRTIDLAGDKRDVLGLVNILTNVKYSRLTNISVVLFCDSSDEDPPTFAEIPSFTAELVSEADEVDIDGDALHVRSRRSPRRSDSVEWSVQWKLVTVFQGFWDTDMIIEVRDDFIAKMRENIWKHCPSALKLTGVIVDELFHEIPRPCSLRSLSIVGDINYLEVSVDYIVSYHNVFELLDFFCYQCSPIPTGVSVLAFACCVTGIISPFPVTRPDRTITMFLRIPVKHLVGEGYTLHRLSIAFSLSDPDSSRLTFHPVLRGNFV